ncbi:MAG: DUF2029 domain-containing protein [Candidatus Liptonbacteria bacterium]|nr:DUF2029 domain-containing protein [Candidatus Liptonbacteria bacterium]
MPYQVLLLLILCLGGFLIVNKAALWFPRGSRADKVTLVLVGSVAALAVFGYTRFGNFFGPSSTGLRTFHYHDIYHYALGAKYFQELGYYSLYDCTYVALRDLSARGVSIPSITDIRSLQNPDVSLPAGQVYDLKQNECRARFAPERWRAFQSDLKVFLDLGWQDQWWRVMLFDLGFNPPPTWNLIMGRLINLVPINPASLSLLPFWDMLLIFPVAGYLIWRSFGAYPAGGYLIAAGTSWLASYEWTGGSFSRQTWLFLLIVALCCLKKGSYRTSAVFFALTSAFRIFPVFFFLGAVWALLGRAYRQADLRVRLVNFLFYFAATASLLFLGSVLWYGTESWADFFHKIIKHGSTFWVMHIGFDKYAVFSPAIAGQNFWFADGLVRFVAWQERLRAIYAAHFLWFTLIKWGALSAALGIGWRVREWLSALLIGGTILFFFQMPANYYYMYLALFPVVIFPARPDWRAAVRLALVFALLAAVSVMPLLSPDQIIHNGYINTLVFCFFLLLYLTFLPPRYSRAFLRKLASRFGRRSKLARLKSTLEMGSSRSPE